MRFLIQCAALIAITFAFRFNVQAQNIEYLQHSLDSLFQNPEFSNATFGVAIQSLRTGEYLYQRNDAKSLTPASNLKLFTSSEALHYLGPHYCFITRLQTDGKIRGHTLFGNLILHGAGDPSFGATSLYLAGANSEVFQQWTKQLRRKGIRSIAGRILVDNSYFSPERYPDGWQIDDAPYYYATPITALTYDENQVSVIISPSRPGKRPWVHYAPQQVHFGILKNLAVTGDATAASTIDAIRLFGSDTIEIIGTIPSSSAPQEEQTSIQFPERYAARALRDALRRARIRMAWKELPSRRGRAILASWTSPPLDSLVRAMNKVSDNVYAEILFRDVAKAIGGEGSWTRGAPVMRNYLASLAIDTEQVQFTDGSGLSRMDLVTAGDIVKVLQVWYPSDLKGSINREDSSPSSPLSHFGPLKESTRQAFYNSLPIMGVDGTLDHRLKGTPAEGNVHAKTGSMTGVRSISGYLTTRDGEPLAFSILANNYTCSGSMIGALEDQVILRLVNFSRK